jgi:hypothetical protein
MEGVTLHEEMIDVLSEAGAHGLSFQAVADRINNRGVYQKRDLSLVGEHQIRLRAKRYPALFRVQDGRVRLRSLDR